MIIVDLHIVYVTVYCLKNTPIWTTKFNCIGIIRVDVWDTKKVIPLITFITLYHSTILHTVALATG